MPEISYRLPSRPLPQPCESTLGYLLRLGDRNGHRSLAWVAQIRRQHSRPDVTLNQFLQQTTGHPEPSLHQIYGPSLPALQPAPSHLLGLKTQFWNSEHRRWCPACLRESGYWKAEWQLTLQIVCPEHGKLLQEHCPGCHKPLRWHGGELFHCFCGQDLRQARTPQADGPLQALGQLISAAFVTSTGGEPAATALQQDWPSELATLHLTRLCELLWSLGCYATFSTVTKPQKVQRHHHLKVLLPILANTARLLSNWPAVFDTFLQERVQPGREYALSLRQFLGQQLAWLHRTLAHPEFHFVRQELERFIALHWKGRITDRHHFISHGVKQRHPVISVGEASQQSCLSRDKLVTLVQQGALQGWSADHHGRRDFLMISRTSLEQFLRASGGMLNLIDSAAYLGVSKGRLKLFVERGLITPTYRPSGGKNDPVQWMFQQQVLDTFLTSVQVNAHATPDCGSLISIDQICRGYTRNGAGMVELLQAIQQGDLKMIGHNPAKVGIGGLLLSRQSFRHWFEQRQPEKTVFSLAGAARYLGIKEHVLYWLRDRGLICDWHQADSKRMTSIHKETLDRFRQRYVWGRELAELSGYGRQSASRALINRGVWPVSGPRTDGGITYVFLREDLENYLRVERE